MFKQIKEFILNLLFPRFCLVCGQEGSHLCQDCISCLEISESQYCLCQKPRKGDKCSKCISKKLDSLYYAVSLENRLCQKLIHKFKHQPFIKELAKPLTSLIIAHFFLLGKKPDFSDFMLIPVPQEVKEIKRRGFNPAQEIAEELRKFLEIPLLSQSLRKNKNIFFCNEPMENKKILLVNDTYVTGNTMEECADALKKAGTQQVIGLVIARG
ncbi:ComF family protein [Candidatus Parcubacteria bacterium]|nr:ComF family protein [Candidatus Parcubacteria bacterium]